MLKNTPMKVNALAVKLTAMISIVFMS